LICSVFFLSFFEQLNWNICKAIVYIYIHIFIYTCIYKFISVRCLLHILFKFSIIKTDRVPNFNNQKQTVLVLKYIIFISRENNTKILPPKALSLFFKSQFSKFSASSSCNTLEYFFFTRLSLLHAFFNFLLNVCIDFSC
jgi:hypothetical protein